MAFTKNQIEEISRMMDRYLEENRPPEDIRRQLDTGWRLQGQSVYLFEIRPQWDNKNIDHHYDFAKSTWVEAQKHWKIFRMRSNGKWYRYDALESAGNLQRFLIEVEKDPYHFFRG
jgi:hypothetical protein